MSVAKRIASIVGIVCGAELVVAIAVGGAGLGAVFGWNGLVLGGAASMLAAGFVTRQRAMARQSASADNPTAPDAASASISSAP